MTEQKPIAVDYAELLTENRLLEETVMSLRSQLEKLSGDKLEAVRDAHMARADEVLRLQQNIVALRTELERLRKSYENRMHELDRNHRIEKAGFLETIKALRSELESKHG